MPAVAFPPFLRVPPFPGARPRTGTPRAAAAIAPAAIAPLAAEIVRLRVGGTFWDRQPMLPPGRDLVLAPPSRDAARRMTACVERLGQAARAVAVAPSAWFADTPIPRLDPRADPWSVAARAGALWTGADTELALVAALCGRPLRIFGPGRFATLGDAAADTPGAVPDRAAVLFALADTLAGAPPVDPFSGAMWDLGAAVAQLGEWRALIEANRVPRSIHGVARWKRVTLDALLWDGRGAVAHAGTRRAKRSPAAGDTVLAWKSRTRGGVIAGLSARGVCVGEIEDGMIRSQGLGAHCVPPLSVIVDREGVHFDPSRPSALERILAHAELPAPLLARAAALRTRLVAAGLSKYGATPPGTAESVPVSGGARRVLVPGQVEDDRSVLTGGFGLTNRALLERARALEPDAHITYRPHPDVEAGHRTGRLAEREVLALADGIERDGAITDAIERADALHVITSLAGFEALMRGKRVVAHGVPFYAGWGLTTDIGAVPAGRGRARSIDELVAAVLILYPRYLDPVTRLPCPVETLVERLAAGEADISSPLVVLRKWQGVLLRMARGLGGPAR